MNILRCLLIFLTIYYLLQFKIGYAIMALGVAKALVE